MSIEKAKGGHRVRWRQNGQQKSKLIPGARKHAVEFEAETKRRLIMGPGQDWWTQGTVSFRDFAADWLERKSQEISRRTELDYATLLDRFLVPSFGDTPLRAINVALIENFRDDALAKGTGKRQLQLALGLLSQILDRAQARGEIQTNPAKLVRGPKQDAKKPVLPLAPKDIERIRGWLLKNKTLQDATLVSVLAYAGLRPGEALALHWRHITVAEIHVEGAVSLGEHGLTKTGKERKVDLLPALAQDLGAYRRSLSRPHPEAPLFPARDAPYWSPHKFANWRRRVWYEALDALKLERRVPYVLRHSFASLLIAEGRNYVEVAVELGHSPNVTLGVYAHVFKDAGKFPGHRTSAADAIAKARGSHLRAVNE